MKSTIGRRATLRRFSCSVLVVTLCVNIAGADDFQKYQEQARAERKKTLNRLITQLAPSVVTVEFVSKENMMGREMKNEMEAPAVMVSPDGMVLAANSRLQGLMTMSMRMAGGIMGNRPMPQSDTEDIKVIVGEDSEEYEAKLVARDSDLDLAWLQITDTKGKTFSYVDFSDSVELEMGDRYYIISRMGRRFDRVPVVSSSTVAAVVENPRPLLVSGGAASTWGSPVFDGDGKVAGFLVTQPPEEGEAGPISLESIASSVGFILPAKKVAKALEQAKEIAKKQETEEP